MRKKQPKEISEHFKALAKKSWEVRRKKILNSKKSEKMESKKENSVKKAGIREERNSWLQAKQPKTR